MAIAEAPPDSEIRQNFDRSVQEFEKQKARRLSLLPVVVRPTDQKYKDLLRIAKPIDIGQSKPIRFDLNAFVPKEFVQLTYPMPPYRDAVTKSSSRKQ